ncbi:bacterial Ig-like domain protein [Plesiocystis pacifica SIR-1]|uniref:Bacterial Ig-like domain protein n=1 Tax=Plesiocystis pacifica SIR-1 TaxID=391625 RepID=A6FYN5_9BACT|nr:IgGFc-binding protein [Plesiocystis pacifica]EDM81307.1 bacterial Ig-like domain protein [Plesiocystis pacifica SIR-1]
MRKTWLEISLPLLSIAALSTGCTDDVVDEADGGQDEIGATETVDESADDTTTETGEESGTMEGSSETADDTTADDTTADTTADDTTADDTTADDTTADDTTADDTTADTTADDTADTTDTTTEDEGTFCEPGLTICFDADNTQTCVDDGSEFGDPVPCDPTETCQNGVCIPLCDAVEAEPSSIGCSFFANRMDNYNPGDNDSLVVGNIDSVKTVSAQLYFVPNGSNVEQAQGAPVNIPPEGTYTFTLTNAQIESQTTIRNGGVYRVETDIPIVAYQHSPIGSVFTNDASMLLPEHALTGNYVVNSYPATVGNYPSYFTAIAVTDGTTVNFTVPEATAGGGGVTALNAGGSTSVMLNRYDTLNVVVQQQNGGDVSGTVVESDGPLWLVGATECANVPNNGTLYCDHMEEANLPLEYWGQEYVGAHVPYRSGNEDFHWRVYGGEDGVQINTDPVQAGFPLTLNKGEWYQFSTTESFIISGDGPFLPVQYMEGTTGGAGDGDPSQIQSVPTEQFLDAYAFVTGTDYPTHYVQIIRPAGGADVLVDGQVVGDYYTVGTFEVADYPLNQEGTHFANSDQPFGIVSVGYSPATSYGYPGGLKLQVINPQ